MGGRGVHWGMVNGSGPLVTSWSQQRHHPRQPKVACALSVSPEGLVETVFSAICYSSCVRYVMYYIHYAIPISLSMRTYEIVLVMFASTYYS